MSHPERAPVYPRGGRLLKLGVALSLALHGAAYASLGLAPQRSEGPLAAASVSFEVVEPTPAPPREPEPATPEPREREPHPASRAREVAKAPPPESAPSRAVAADTEAVVLRGVTLTNDSGDALWTSDQGDGSAFDGAATAIGRSGKASRPLALAASSRAHVQHEGPLLVSSKDLSVRPAPPALEAALRRHYPEQARRRALSGEASLRLTIAADGGVLGAKIQSESAGGFGDACRRALLSSRWSPPRDRDGRAVATEVRYTCRFLVD